MTIAGEVLALSADSVSGDVFLDLTGTPDEVRINTVSGNTTTRLDADAPASYTINTVTGKLQLDQAEIRGVRGRYSAKYGELDSRWLDLRVNTVSGDISVLHTVRA